MEISTENVMDRLKDVSRTDTWAGVARVIGVSSILITTNVAQGKRYETVRCHKETANSLCQSG